MRHIGVLGRAVAILSLVLASLSGGGAHAADAKMGIFEYRLIAFGLDPDSHAAQPRKLWRVGDSHLRYEEARNAENNVQVAAVVAMPDVWLFDRVAKRGTHTIDPGPTYRVRFPVFAGQAGDLLADLEIGHEESFFAARDPKDLGRLTVAGVECAHSQIEVGGNKVTLYRRVADGKPFQVAIEVDGRVLAVRYLRYDVGMPADMALFRPPQDVAFEEAKK